MASESMLSIGMGGDSGAGTRLKAFNATVRMVAWADRIGVGMEHELKSRAPVDARGRAGAGRLRESIGYQRTTRLGGVQLSFHSTDPAARYVIEGTRPHTYGGNGLVLHWIGAHGEAFRHQVSHPGIKHPNNFPQKALDHMLPELAASFAALFERI
jgi:hypothetical protein